MSEHPTTEGGHWYHRDGTPAYTVTGKNGKERPTTLRDARKLDLVPSVTTIIKCAAAPGLEAWKQEQVILACLTMPRVEGEPEAQYIARIKEDAAAQAKAAAERGTQIHAWVQEYINGKGCPESMQFGFAAWDALSKECGVHQAWICEKSFCHYDYGGKVDLYCDGYLVDIKTTEKPLDGIKTWPEHHMQLAAYDIGIDDDGTNLLSGRRCGILYINSLTAEAKLIWVSDDDVSRGASMFGALRDYWYAKTGL